MFFQLAIHLLLVTSALAKPLFTGYEDIAPRQAAPSNSTFTPQQLLALNIGVDIMAQKGQIAAVEMIQQMQQGGIKDAKAFNATKASLMTLISSSIQIRGSSQQLAPAQLAVVPGLAQLEESQVKGSILANQLTGDPASDTQSLQQLKQAFQADVAMNQMLQAKATASSVSSTSSPTAMATK